MAEFRERAGERVRLTVPKPREDQRLVGTIAVADERVVVEVDADGVAAGSAHTQIELRERARDGVVRAFRGRDGDVLVGRVARVEVLEDEAGADEER